MPWWRTHRAPSTGDSYQTGVSSEHSRLVPRPVVLDVLALPCSALDRADDVPALWQVGTASHSLRVTVPQIQVKAVVKFEHPRIPAFQPFMKPVSYFLRKQFHAVQCLYQL